jgi:glycosyltransferase involved in cell wall biosynthesis
MKLSLVIPTYKKENVVAKQISRLYKYLKSQDISFEIIIVIDGIADRSKEIVESLKKEKKLRNVKIIGYPKNRGKGYAVRYGMKRAKGDIVGFIDADTDILPKSLEVAYKRIIKGDVDMVAPSKLDPRSNFKMSLKRKIFSGGLRIYSRLLLRQPQKVKDISVGLKLFTKASAKLIFPKTTVDRFAMDSEIFNIAAKNNLNVGIVPIYLNGRSKSTSTNFRSISQMMIDILRLSIDNSKTQVTEFKRIIASALKLDIAR